ncbi:tRNA (cytidine(56)-2'-O)-methyltransferase [archaeon]|nr:tRNA (cytidine(56)-2'-O)-methyltransferase [archaeon]
MVLLRLGHRRKRDARLTTHVALAARALGASKAIICGELDKKLIRGVNAMSEKWGGAFRAVSGKRWKNELLNLKKLGFTIVHLTMYGIPFGEKLAALKRKTHLAVVVGGEKVPGEVYRLADYNLSVTSQPHSEVAALAVLLHSLNVKPSFSKAKIKVIPKEHGKLVVN